MLRLISPLVLVLALLSCGEQPTPQDSVSSAVSDQTEAKALDAARVYTTAENTEKRLSEDGVLAFESAGQPLETEVAIFVNPEKKFQTFLGIGGAITDASAEVFSQLSPAQQEALLEAYYGEEGIGYNIIRTSIHSCDFRAGQPYLHRRRGLGAGHVLHRAGHGEAHSHDQAGGGNGGRGLWCFTRALGARRLS